MKLCKPGSDLVFRILRDGRELDITVAVGALPFVRQFQLK